MKHAIARLQIELDILAANYLIFVEEGRVDEAENVKRQRTSINSALTILETIDSVLIPT